MRWRQTREAMNTLAGDGRPKGAVRRACLAPAERATHRAPHIHRPVLVAQSPHTAARVRWNAKP